MGSDGIIDKFDLRFRGIEFKFIWCILLCIIFLQMNSKNAVETEALKH